MKHLSALFLLLLIGLAACDGGSKASSGSAITGNVVVDVMEVHCGKTTDPLYCSYKKAVEQRAPQYCKEAGTQMGRCLLDVADVLSPTVEMLDEIEALCDFAGKLKDACLFKSAIKKRSESTCQKIRGVRKDQCLTRLEFIEGAPSLCAEQEDNEECILKIAVDNFDINLCSRAGSLQDECFYRLSKKSQSDVLCRFSGQMQERCLTELRVEEKFTIQN